MSFLPVILLAAAAFAIAVYALRLPRHAWTLTGAALLFGLTGYALQGSPGQGGAPKSAARVAAADGAALVDARRALFDAVPDSPFVTVADGFIRRGQYSDAAGILNGAIDRSPDDREVWLALATALVGHAEGQLTPAAIQAFDRAQRLDPENPGPALFLGVALVQNGRFAEARSLWRDTLAAAPADAPWRAGLADRIVLLDALIAQAEAR